MQLKNKVILFDIDYTLFNTDIFNETKLQKYSLYEEVKEALNNLSKIARLGIFSEGEIRLQKTKLESTNIADYFQNDLVHIMTRKDDEMEDIITRYTDTALFLVDDKIDILYKTKKLFPSVFTVWIKRGKYAKSQKPIDGFEPDAIIKTLQEVIPVVST